MSLNFTILGEPGRDNALFVRADSGQSLHRFLFDCGEGCLTAVPVSELQAVDALFFSHLHIDHVAGFDSFLRHNFDRPTGPVRVFGPTGTAEAIHHRLRGVTWNLVEGRTGEFLITDIKPDCSVTKRMLTAEGFATAYDVGEAPFRGVIYEDGHVRVEGRVMDHGIPCMAYVVREAARANIDPAKVARLGLKPGPWMRQLKETAGADIDTITIDGTPHRLMDLRRELLVTTCGQSLAYLTDFSVDVEAAPDFLAMVRGCDVIVCENNFRDADRELAVRSHHMVSSQVGRIAVLAGAGRLVLFHLSDRYTRSQWLELLEEVRSVFPGAEFPEGWI